MHNYIPLQQEDNMKHIKGNIPYIDM